MSASGKLVETVITDEVIKHEEGQALLKKESLQLPQTLVLSH